MKAKYALGSEEHLQWQRKHHFSPKGIGFKEPGVVGTDAKQFAAFNVAKSFYQVYPQVFNLKLVSEKLGISADEAGRRLKRMYDERCMMLVKNSSVSVLGFGLYYWVVKMKKGAEKEKAELSRWIQEKDDICTGYETEGDFDFYCGNHMRTLDNLLVTSIEPIRRFPGVESIQVCPIRRDIRESHVNLWDAPIEDYRRYQWSEEQLEKVLTVQDLMDKTDFDIIDVLNNVESVADMFDYDYLEKLSGLDAKEMKEDLAYIVDKQKYMIPMIYVNYRRLGLHMHCFLVRTFQGLDSWRKEEINDELSRNPAFNNIFEFTDAYYDMILTAYDEITDLDAIRADLDKYAEIEQVWEASSPKQFRRWTCRLDDESDMWEECIFTDDFLQERKLDEGGDSCEG